LTQVVPGTGTTLYQYAGNTTTVTDPEGHKKKYVYNEFGSIEKLYEQDDHGNLTVLTKYKYSTQIDYQRQGTNDECVDIGWNRL
jgi:YD repeat-containing protein